MDDTAKIKSNWQAALSACNLNPRKLAREIGISHTYLYAIIAGKIFPSEPIRTRLLNHLKGYTSDKLFNPVILAPATTTKIICKRCHSTHIIKSGVFKGTQRYQCKDCACVFIDNQSSFRGRFPIKAVVVVLEHFFKGEPLDFIRSLIEDSEQIQISLSGIENLASRYSREAVQLVGDIIPPLSPQWILEYTAIPADRPVCFLDVLDMNTGFLIASDLIQANVEKEREDVLQKALRRTHSTPEMLVLGPILCSENLDLELDLESMPRGFPLNQNHLSVLLKFSELNCARTQLVTRRLNYGNLSSSRLACSAWRVHYNYLSDFKPAGGCRYNSWLDIVTGISDL